MRNRVAVALLVGILVTAFSFAVAAQDDDPIKLPEGVGLELESGLLALSYPEDWFAQTTDGVLLLQGLNGTGAIVTVAPRAGLDDPEISAGDYHMAQIAAETEEAGSDPRYAGLDEFEAVELNGREAAISTRSGGLGALEVDVTVITVDAGGALVTFVFSAVEDADADGITRAIAGSVDFAAPSQSVALTQRIDTTDGNFSVRYPTDWAAYENAGALYIASTEALLNSDTGTPESGEFTGSFQFFGRDLAAALTDDVTTGGLLSAFAGEIERIDSAIRLEIDSVFLFERDTVAVIFGNVSDDETTLDIALSATQIESSGDYVIGVFATALDEIGSFESLLVAIMASIEQGTATPSGTI